MTKTRQRVASAIVFCPQNRPAKVDYLKQLRNELCSSPILAPFRQAILDLPQTWNLYAGINANIAALTQGPHHIRQLRDWIEDGVAEPLVETMSGILILPLLTVIHITQYFQYLQSLQMSHVDFLEDIRVGGAQGLCGGLLAAMAIAASRDEVELITNACTSLRLALCIGACGELGDDQENLGASTVVLRIKQVGQADEIVAKFPGTYVATVADPWSISVVGSVPQLANLKAYAEAQGISTTELHLRGKVHNPENKDLCAQLVELAMKTPSLQLPTAEALRVPVRSNKTGGVLCNVPLSKEVLESALMTRCEWYSIVTAMSEDLSKTSETTHRVTTFGTGRKNCLAAEQFEKRSLTIEKLDVVKEVDSAVVRKPRYNDHAIAVVGASCRLPGANNLEEFWDVVASGQDTHKELPTDRFDLPGSHRSSLCPDYSQGRKFYGNLLDQVDKFDHKFFGMSAREAINTDPQQRVLLELAYQAMESSGYMRTHDRSRGDNIGVFIGASFVEYLDNTNANPPTAYTSTGTIRAFLCGRLSYYFGWTGPAEVIDTACSSSLVAINRAVRAIQNGECDSALAGGINIITGQNNFLDLGRAGFLSQTGQCKPFDKNADGYCRAEGGGLVFLKALPTAQRQGDRVIVVIPASGTNQGGLSCALTIPDSTALSTLYRSVLTQASFPSDAVTYVEAHGTGTQKGDPVEVASVRNVFGNANRQEKLYLGSVKGNIGHCETAAGVAGLMKVIAMLDKGKLPPQANHKTWNPKIPALQPDGMSLSGQLQPWKPSFKAALVNSYGAAGSNAALLCSEPPSVARPSTAEGLRGASFPMILSAKTESSLKAYKATLGRYLEQATNPPNIFDIAYTLAERRQRHQFSTIIQATRTPTLIAALQSDQSPVFQRAKSPDSVVLLLGGQHKRNIGLARQLYDRYPYFHAQVNNCNAIVQELGCPSIIPAVFESTGIITDVVVLQSGLVAVEYALAMCWIKAGLRVSALVGHSLGELAGLAVSGMLSLHDCLKLVVGRASLIQSTWGEEKGAMIAVSASRETVHDILTETKFPVDVACYNSPSGQVVAGDAASISAFETNLKDRVPPVKCTRVDTSHGFHSRLADPILEQLDELSASLDWQEPALPIRLCSQEARSTALPYSPSAHARNPVYFESTLKRVEAEVGKATWIEVSVNSPVVPMAKRALDAGTKHCFYTMSMTDESSSSDVISRTVSDLWRQSIDVSHWATLHTTAAQSAVWLPPYQFDQTSVWLDNIDHAAELQKQLAEGPKAAPVPTVVLPLERQLVIPLPKDVGQKPGEERFRVSPHSERFQTIVSGHAVRNQPLCPASVYLECVAMAMATVSPLDSTAKLEFEKLDLQAPLGLLCEDIEVSIVPAASREKTWDFAMTSINPKTPAKRNMHGQGTVSFAGRSNLAVMERLVQRQIQDFEARGNAEKLLSRRAYDLFSRVVNYKDFLRGISSISIDGTEAIAKIKVPENQPALEESSAAAICEAVTMDNFIQVVGLLMNTSDLVGSNEVMVCTGIEYGATNAAYDMIGQKAWTVHAAYSPIGSSKATGDVFVFGQDGSLVAAFTGCQFTKLAIASLERALASVNRGNGGSASSNAPKQVVTVVPRPQPSANAARPSIPRLDSMPPLSTGSSDTSSSNPPSPGGPDVLLTMLERLTGAAPSDISEEADLADLGIDSLAAIDFASELAGSFKVTIDGGDLLGMTVGELRGMLKIPSSKSRREITLTPAVSVDEPVVVAIPQGDVNLGADAAILALFAETTGLSPSEIETNITLDDLGVDSLALVEVCAGLSKIVNRPVQPEDLSSDMSIAQVLLGFAPDPLKQVGATTTVQIVPQSSQPQAALPRSTSAGSQASLAMDMSSALTTCEAAAQGAAVAHSYQDYWAEVGPQQDRLTIVYILEALSKLGIDLASLQPGSVLPAIPHPPRYAKLVQRIWDILASHDIVQQENSGRVVAGKTAGFFARETSASLHDAFVQKHPQYAGEARLMQLTGPKLAECLTGDADAVKLLFGSAASSKILEDYYGKSPMLSFMTSQLATLVTALFESGRGQNSEPFHILEVGAGTGGTTGEVINMLQSRGLNVTYTFTDISATLVSKAKRRFAANSAWMSFEKVDLDRAIPSHLQGKFDVVFATNCVHATKDRVGTCSRIREMLKSDGFMILSEVTQIIAWYDIVFGLLDGWWLSESPNTYPLQPPEQWMKEFKVAGYQSTAYTRGSNEDLSTQRLLIGSNGEVAALDDR